MAEPTQTDDWTRPGGPETGEVPGKLMLAGEYAVVNHRATAIAMAVGNLVRWRLGPESEAPMLTMSAFGTTASQPMAAIDGAGLWQLAGTVLQHLRDLHVAPKRAIELQVAGHVGGRKLGLGTSSAVTLALLQAALVEAGRPLDPAWLMKQGLAIHGAAQGGRGSGYDIATQAWGGLISYRQPPAEVKVLVWPSGLFGAALWTGTPADTTSALRRGVQHDKARMKAIAAQSEALLARWQAGDVPRILAALAASEAAFGDLARGHGHLVPATARELIAVIEGRGAVARTSGAGGGDCLLALAANVAVIDAVVADWRATGGHCVARLPDDIRLLERQ